MIFTSGWEPLEGYRANEGEIQHMGMGGGWNEF